MSESLLREMKEIGQRIRTQDNRITDAPIFIVQKKVRDYGYDPAYADEIAWIDREEGEEVESGKAEQLEKQYRLSHTVPKDYIRARYVERWEFVTACFTEQGCKDYIKINGHNLGETRIYADGSFRNNEYRAVREFLMSLIDQE